MITINIQIRPAEPEDVKLRKNVLLLGKMYFLKSDLSGEFSGPYFLTDYIDKAEFTTWFKKGMVYVGVSPLDNKVTLIN